MSTPEPVLAGPGILLVLDGWGSADAADDNALSLARTPVLDELVAQHPSTLAEASGEAVGLLPGTVGNSEIGHMVIGAGRPSPTTASWSSRPSTAAPCAAIRGWTPC